MYRLRYHRRHRVWIWCCIAAAACALGVLIIPRVPHAFQADTSLTQSNPVIHHVSSTTAPTQHITQQPFTLELPSGWRRVAPPNVPYTAYSWQGAGADAARHLDVYVDRIPSDLAVNRLLAVQPAGDHMNILDTVSDNCTNFTDKATESLATGTAPAKWADVNFICDMGNYERNVVAIGSAGAVNDVALAGPATGRHHVLLVYWDNSADPDYTLFTAIVQSFEVL